MMAVSRRVRSTWIVFGALLTVAALGWGTFQTVNALALDKQRFRTRFDERITSIEVDSGAGSLTIVGSDRDDVVVVGRITRSLRAPRHRETVVDGTLRLTSSCEWVAAFCTLDYELRVPEDLAVTATISGGGAHVRGMAAALTLTASGGGVHVEDAYGRLRLSSSGGGVTATALRSQVVRADSSGGGVHLSFLVAPRSVDASSSGGGVDVTVPDDGTEYAVDASSSGGGTTVEVPVRDRSDRRIHASSSGGGVDVVHTSPR